MDGRGNVHPEILEVVVAYIFIKGNGTDQHPAGGVGDSDQIEITLQPSIFAGCPVNRDVGKVKTDLFSLFLKAEIVLVDDRFGAVWPLHEPFVLLNDGNI